MEKHYNIYYYEEYVCSTWADEEDIDSIAFHIVFSKFRKEYLEKFIEYYCEQLEEYLFNNEIDPYLMTDEDMDKFLDKLDKFFADYFEYSYKEIIEK